MNVPAFAGSPVLARIHRMDWADRTEGRGNAGKTANSFFHPSGPSEFGYLIQRKSLIPQSKLARGDARMSFHPMEWTAPDGIECARMRSLQISDKGNRPWNRLAELGWTRRSTFSASRGECRRGAGSAQEAPAQGDDDIFREACPDRGRDRSL